MVWLKDCCTPTEPIQLEGAGADLPWRMDKNPSVKMCQTYRDIPLEMCSCKIGKLPRGWILLQATVPPILPYIMCMSCWLCNNVQQQYMSGCSCGYFSSPCRTLGLHTGMQGVFLPIYNTLCFCILPVDPYRIGSLMFMQLPWQGLSFGEEQGRCRTIHIILSGISDKLGCQPQKYHLSSL